MIETSGTLTCVFHVHAGAERASATSMRRPGSSGALEHHWIRGGASWCYSISTPRRGQKSSSLDRPRNFALALNYLIACIVLPLFLSGISYAALDAVPINQLRVEPTRVVLNHEKR